MESYSSKALNVKLLFILVWIFKQWQEKLISPLLFRKQPYFGLLHFHHIPTLRHCLHSTVGMWPTPHLASTTLLVYKLKNTATALSLSPQLHLHLLATYTLFLGLSTALHDSIFILCLPVCCCILLHFITHFNGLPVAAFIAT